MAKYLAAEYCNEVVEDSFRIHGGYGYSKEYEIERLYREAPMLLIGEGTADIQKMIIGRAPARGLQAQGLMGPAPLALPVCPWDFHGTRSLTHLPPSPLVGTLGVYMPLELPAERRYLGNSAAPQTVFPSRPSASLSRSSSRSTAGTSSSTTTSRTSVRRSLSRRLSSTATWRSATWRSSSTRRRPAEPGRAPCGQCSVSGPHASSSLPSGRSRGSPCPAARGRCPRRGHHAAAVRRDLGGDLVRVGVGAGVRPEERALPRFAAVRNSRNVWPPDRPTIEQNRHSPAPRGSASASTSSRA